MFKKTVNLSDFKAHAPDILGLLGDNGPNDAIQLIHRASTIKVVITQERYFRLLEKIQAYEERFGKRRPELIDINEGSFDVDFDKQMQEGVNLANADKR